VAGDIKDMNLTSHSSLDKYVVLQFKSGLREQQRELQQSIEQAESAIRDLAESTPRDPADAASDHSLEGSVIAQLGQNRNRLRLVEGALDRIRIGEFGNCANCGDAISLKRLQAVPWTSYCVPCQEQHEQGTTARTLTALEHLPA
jgi:DnaK suppressor protein